MRTVWITGRGHIEFVYQGRRLKVPGEALLAEGEGPEFVVFSSAFDSWTYPDSDEPISLTDRDAVMRALQFEAERSGVRIVVE
jgi:hypothetical protein